MIQKMGCFRLVMMLTTLGVGCLHCQSVRHDHGPPGDDAGSTIRPDAGDPLLPNEGDFAGDGWQPHWEPGSPCREIVLPCLDAGDASVIEVPTEMTLEQAFDQVQPGQTVQVRGLWLGAGWWIPPNITLRGCDQAKIVGDIAFRGGGGIEGFQVEATVVANQTGTYQIRYNQFVQNDPTTEPGLSIRAIDGYVGAVINARVDSNTFVDRPAGLELQTSYNTLTRQITATIQNNIFAGVDRPIEVIEGGVPGEIAASILHNTFFGFVTAVTLYDVAAPTALEGNLLVAGQLAIDANSPFSVSYDNIWSVDTPYAGPLLEGDFSELNPAFVSTATYDFRLSSASEVVDQVPNAASVPAVDFFGCPRPTPALSPTPRADLGALEAQP